MIWCRERKGTRFLSKGEREKNVSRTFVPELKIIGICIKINHLFLFIFCLYCNCPNKLSPGAAVNWLAHVTVMRSSMLSELLIMTALVVHRVARIVLLCAMCPQCTYNPDNFIRIKYSAISTGASTCTELNLIFICSPFIIVLIKTKEKRLPSCHSICGTST